MPRNEKSENRNRKRSDDEGKSDLTVSPLPARPPKLSGKSGGEKQSLSPRSPRKTEDRMSINRNGFNRCIQRMQIVMHGRCECSNSMTIRAMGNSVSAGLVLKWLHCPLEVDALMNKDGSGRPSEYGPEIKSRHFTEGKARRILAKESCQNQKISTIKKMHSKSVNSGRIVSVQKT